MQKKILVTAALPYANGALHFGHLAGAYLPADCYVRYLRMMKEDVLFICGSDEYGIPITISAEAAGRTPKEHVDLFHAINETIFQRFEIDFDHYSRTTWQGHVEATHQFFLDLLKNGHIEERITDQLYSEADGKFLADRYVVGECPQCGFEKARGDECTRCGASYEATALKNPKSKLTGAPLISKPTKHWFLLLEHFKEHLKEWVAKKSWKTNVVNFIQGYIDELHARAITRDMSWGIKLPVENAEGKVLYVWFDAPIGYISATKEWALKRGEKDKWKEYWCDENTRLVQFMGKDNIPFHASIFPAMIMGQDSPYKLVDELSANEFYHLEGKQFSKSDNWYIDVEDFLNRYTADQIRYTIAANAPESADSEFTWKDFQIRCNSELVGKYGNLANRVLSFIQTRCEAVAPSLDHIEQVDKEFLENVSRIVQESSDAYEQFKVRKASQLIMELSQLGNGYFDAKHPWKDVKDPALHSRMQTTLACCLECLKALALISFPIIPKAAETLWKMLGFDKGILDYGWKEGIKVAISPAGGKLPVPERLFDKVEDSAIEEEILKLKG